MYTLIEQTEEEYWQLTEIEKEEAVVLTISQKMIIQLIKGLAMLQVYLSWISNDPWIS